MRKTIASLFVIGAVVWSGVARSQDAKDPRAIIDRAIKAVGGEEKLKKHQGATWTEKGTYYGMEKALPFTGKYAVQWPDQFKMEIEGFFTIVFNKDKCWFKNGGETKEMDKEETARQASDHRAGWVTTLLPLKDKAFKLTTIGDADVEKTPAVGVRVTREGYPDVSLYFDKKSGRLIKSAHRSFSQENKKEVNAEMYYKDYKEMEGVQVATHLILMHDGKKFVEANVSDVRAMGKLDPSIFQKP
jgi:hypothetical protein